MKDFEIQTTKNLNETGEEVITIKKIISSEIRNLIDLRLRVTKTYRDHVESSFLPIYDENILYTTVPEINIDIKIVDCSISIMEVVSPINKTFTIFYETLADKLKQLAEKEDQSRSNIQNEINKWKKSVSNLFNEIITWIQPYKDSISYDMIVENTSEELTGPYQIPVLTIKPSIGKIINFAPLGTFVIGSQGRIDVNIPNFGKSIMIILNRENGEDKWIITFNRNFKAAQPFTKSQFINLLDEVIPA